MNAGAAADVIIVGSGPAGVSAAWPLVEAGVRVLMVDGSEASLPRPPAHESLGEWREDPDRWRIELGRNGPIASAKLSPKFATSLARATLAGFEPAAGLTTRDFLAVGSLAAGGLSRIWGALAVRYAADDLAAFGAEAPDIEAGYERVGRRIGLSHAGEEGAGERGRAAAHLLARFERSRSVGDFTLAPAPNAVLAAARGGRLGCSSCGLCLHGCGRGSIYQSADEVTVLRRHRNFAYRPGVRVERLACEQDGNVVHAQTTAGPVRLVAPAVVLAAGTIMTTSLALRGLGQSGRSVRLQSNPVGGAAFLAPRFLGETLPARSFGLGQLFYTLGLADGGEAAGVFYGADTLPLAAIADRLPMTRPAALRTARAMAPALLLASCYLPGRYSDNRLVVTDDGRAGHVAIQGRQTDEATALLRATLRRLGRQALRLGVLPVPLSAQILGPGADAHPAGTLPLGGDDTASDGQLRAAPGIYLADGSSLPTLSARHPTLTIMANADRIGRALARRLAPPRMIARPSIEARAGVDRERAAAPIC